MGASLSAVEYARPAQFASATLILLQDAVLKYELSVASTESRKPSPQRERNLALALDQLTREAQAGKLGPETVVVALKWAYAAVPPEIAPDGVRVSNRYHLVFQRCLDAYFGSLR